MTQLCKLEECNPNNLRLLSRYETICKNKGLTDRSIEGFCKYDIPLFLRFIKDLPLESVTHITIEDFFDYCTKERKNSDAALDRKYTSLNSFFKTMIKKEYLNMSSYKNPMDKVDPIKVRVKVRGHVTEEELEMMLEYVDSINDLRGAALISFAFSSACRLSEIYSINIEDLDFKKKRVKVLGKGQKERIAIFSEDAKSRLLKYISSRKDDLEPLFISREHNRWSKKAIQVYIKSVAKKCGITKNISPHLMRHGRAMALLKHNIPLDIIQHVLGHSQISTTQIYAHQNINDVQERVNLLDESLKL